MFWHALISLVHIRDAGVPYHFCHSVEDEDRPHDMHDEEVLCRMRIVRLCREIVCNPRWLRLSYPLGRALRARHLATNSNPHPLLT
jgi:hypothetical protein